MAKIIQFKSKAQLEQEAREEMERGWLEFLEWERQMMVKHRDKMKQDIFVLSDELKNLKF